MMTSQEQQKEDIISNKIASAALSAYASLPKTGKPQLHEHTVLAAIALTLPPHAANCLGSAGPIIVSMATGTKCLPGSKRAIDGSALNDCHAEVLARRGFIRWMYDEIHHCSTWNIDSTGGSGSTIATTADQEIPSKAPLNSAQSLILRLKHLDNDVGGKKIVAEMLQGVKIHLFVSHPPCGDAAIQSDPSSTSEMAFRTGAKPMKRQKLDTNNGGEEETTKVESNLGSPVGEWILPEVGDVESYAHEQVAGVVRRKPGRGDPTLSVSCSDKVAKWSLIGLQGALLSSLLGHPLYLDTITVAHPVQDSAKRDVIEAGLEKSTLALKRAFVDRLDSVRPRLATHPFFQQSSTPPEVSAVPVALSDLQELGFISGNGRKVPSGTCIAWRAPPTATWQLKETKTIYRAVAPLVSVTPDDDVLPQTSPLVVKEGICESLTGLFGSLAGKGRKGNDPVKIENQSLLCRYMMFQRVAQVVSALDGSRFGSQPWAESYRKAKQDLGKDYMEAWSALLVPPSPFEGWISKPDVGSVFPLKVPWW